MSWSIIKKSRNVPKIRCWNNHVYQKKYQHLLNKSKILTCCSQLISGTCNSGILRSAVFKSQTSNASWTSADGSSGMLTPSSLYRWRITTAFFCTEENRGFHVLLHNYFKHTRSILKKQRTKNVLFFHLRFLQVETTSSAYTKYHKL